MKIELLVQSITIQTILNVQMTIYLVNLQEKNSG